jgi:hypothetical protein
MQWDPTKEPEPAGWERHPTTNRYRVGGDPAREFNPDDDPPPGFCHPWSIEHGWTRADGTRGAQGG